MPNKIILNHQLGPTGDEVRRLLLDRISSGALQPGQKLGAERDLSLEFEVSRSSLRQALASLEADGTIRRIPGRGGGTFVSGGKVVRDLSRIVGVPALLRDQGFIAGTKVLSASVVVANGPTSKALRIPAAGFVCDITRIRLADGSPISLENARFSAERFPGLLELPLGGSLYELLQSEYGVEPVEAEERIEVVFSTEDEGLILGVATGSPLLSITRTSFDSGGMPLEHSHDLFRADRTRITVRTKGDPVTTASTTTRGNIVEFRTRT